MRSAPVQSPQSRWRCGCDLARKHVLGTHPVPQPGTPARLLSFFGSHGWNVVDCRWRRSGRRLVTAADELPSNCRAAGVRHISARQPSVGRGQEQRRYCWPFGRFSTYQVAGEYELVRKHFIGAHPARLREEGAGRIKRKRSEPQTSRNPNPNATCKSKTRQRTLNGNPQW